MTTSGSRVLIVDEPHSCRHQPPEGHPESAHRVEAVRRAIAAIDGLEHHPGRLAEPSELELVHTVEHVQRIKQLCEEGGGPIDPDTFASPGTYEAARGAVGAGLAAVDELTRRPDLTAAFVVSRPPGHHATRDRAFGFCFFNSIAVAATRLVDGGDRVSVIDWDAHHGNGTQDIFWENDRVQYVSLHQERLYPGSGNPHERGPRPGGLTTFNIPLPAGATGDVYLDAFDRLVEPIVDRFDPDWILVSAGFDAHTDDPLAALALEADDFALLTERVAAWTPNPPIMFLEGGYDLEALDASVTAVLRALLEPARDRWRATVGGPGRSRITELARLWSA